MASDKPMYQLCFSVVELDPAAQDHRVVHTTPTSEPPSEDVYELIDRIHAHLAAMKPLPREGKENG